VSIEFRSELGDIPLLKVEAEPVSGSIVIVEAQKGTKENDPCSGRGICNEKTGICDCFVTAADGSRGSGTASTAFLKAGFVSSDGDGNAGSRGDCGHVNSHCDNSMSLGVRNLETQDWRGHSTPGFTNNRVGG